VTEQPTTSNFSKFEEYKLFVEDTARFSDRRQSVSNFIVAVNGLLVGTVALIITNSDRRALYLFPVGVLLLLAGIAVCCAWLKLIRRYKEMINFRCNQLEAIESQIADSHRMYRNIRWKFKDPSFSDLEQWLPWVFIVLYSLLLIGIVLGIGLLGYARIVHVLLRLL